MPPKWPRGGMVDAPDLGSDVARRGSPSKIKVARGRGSKAWLKQANRNRRYALFGSQGAI